VRRLPSASVRSREQRCGRTSLRCISDTMNPFETAEATAILAGSGAATPPAAGPTTQAPVEDAGASESEKPASAPTAGPTLPVSSMASQDLSIDADKQMAAILSTEKMFSARESTIREKIRTNYQRMQQLEQELGDLRRDMQMTSGPKKMALEMMRQKIEESSMHVQQIRQQKRDLEATLVDVERKLVEAEESKAKLCEDLRLLIEQDTKEQFQKLEEITSKLEALGGGIGVGAQSAPDTTTTQAVEVQSENGSVVPQAASPSAEATSAQATEGTASSRKKDEAYEQARAARQKHIPPTKPKKKVSNAAKSPGFGSVPAAGASTRPPRTGSAAGFSVKPSSTRSGAFAGFDEEDIA